MHIANVWHTWQICLPDTSCRTSIGGEGRIDDALHAADIAFAGGAACQYPPNDPGLEQ